MIVNHIECNANLFRKYYFSNTHMIFKHWLAYFNNMWFLLSKKKDEKDKIVDSEIILKVFTNLSFSQEWDFIFRQLWPYYVHNKHFHDNESFN